MIEKIDACARELVALRRGGGKIARLPDAIRPTTLDEAYAVQRRAVELWGDAIAGWKVGATSQEVQTLFKIGEPVFAPVFRKNVVESPARVAAAAFQHRILESEFALRLGRSLPARPAPYTGDEILAAVDAVIPSFEIISPRFTTLTVGEVPQLVADFVANGGAVLGRPYADWRGLDLAQHSAELSIGGKPRQRGTGALALGSPLNVLMWLVNRLSSQGIALEAGQFVMTGTVTGVHAPEPDEIAIADFGTLGKVEITFESA
jgi:2-keto-4-pentenoate hydratase